MPTTDREELLIVVDEVRQMKEKLSPPTILILKEFGIEL